YLRSLPFLGPFCLFALLPLNPPPKNEEKMSPKSPKSLNPSNPVEYVYVPFPNGPPAPPPNPCGPSGPNWSYICLFLGSDNVSYASFTSLNLASASSLLSGLASG